ncbi:polysaccharide biosynthesis protein [Deinococcus peraridilitoris]|uniref:UDP-glucose 4-epimerase n=1 Tax=Deinococcus peraridilitoris (strain DSM 19664 / LMG 22246 / CIP 109416 / KR-200) TaxID=937777 RepID=K9ZZX9_DEIPD|nr:polysaccharide biosynthesis protein [Deinococcus peraridilitoris]AFZ66492.1 putative nucleoside-diphosphate sugar epimerase [Deinococcus peraridilitoris DSM 19664]
MSANLTNKTVLITGGTGSFGKTMLERVLREDVREVRIFSRDELKQEHLRIELRDPRVRFYLGDVRDRASVDGAMHGVNLVFHAAALKQVPSCEFFPMQAVMTNVVGSHNVVESAVAHRVQHVVCLSTDKAAYPVNAMGMTKGLMEKVAQSVARRLEPDDTVVSSVRYGNVMYSRGSVIPLFIQQIKANQPITVTDGRMTRFMMSLEDAIELVLFSFGHARQGDMFVKKAPACTVEDLAQALQNLFGTSVPVRTIGMRHGEKLFETLATVGELAHSQDMGDYLRVAMDDRDLNYEKYFTEGEPDEADLDDYTSHNTHRMAVKEIEHLLLTLPAVRAELSSWETVT